MKTANTRWHDGAVTPEDRAAALGFKGATVWMTGLPASGKSTLAVEVEALLIGAGRPALRLDGDNLRHGLNGNLGFAKEDRAENVRRTAHAAALLAEAGVARSSRSSPPTRPTATPRGRSTRRPACPSSRSGSRPASPSASGATRRGLYARARAGELQGLTGVGDVYEAPESPELTIGDAEPIPAAARRACSARSAQPAPSSRRPRSPSAISAGPWW